MITNFNEFLNEISKASNYSVENLEWDKKSLYEFLKSMMNKEDIEFDLEHQAPIYMYGQQGIDYTGYGQPETEEGLKEFISKVNGLFKKKFKDYDTWNKDGWIHYYYEGGYFNFNFSIKEK